MTDEQINVAIAEACGWTEIDGLSAKGLMGKPPESLRSFNCIPNYCTDLNAIAEACESVFSESNAWSNFVYKLSKIICAGHYTDHDTLIMTNRATARQRAEAFLRALGKWEEVQG